MRSVHPRILSVVLFLSLALPLPAFAHENALVITHVNVIPMTVGDQSIPDAMVVIKNDRIHAIGSSSAVPEHGVRIIDGRGKWLIPALADMHVHLENDRLARLYFRDPRIPTGTVKSADALLPYVANGVLQIAVLSAMPETIAQRDEVASGRVLGPHIAIAAMIDGPSPILPVGVTRVAQSPSDGRQAVRDIAGDGYDFIKVYSKLDLETFLAIADEARKHGLKVAGHLPQRGAELTDKLFVPGFDMVVHAEEYAMQTQVPASAEIARYAQLAKQNDTWLTTTLTLDERILEQLKNPKTLEIRPEMRYLSPKMRSFVIDHNPYLPHLSPGYIQFVESVVAFNRELVREFASRGVRLVAGTDALVPGVVPGFSLHDELETLVAAGLTPRQALEAGTRSPAEWLGTLEDRGEVVVGKRADLLLLDGDPLANIANTRRIAAVIASGKYLSRNELDAAMAELKDRYKGSDARTRTY